MSKNEPSGLARRPHVGRFPIPYITAVIDGEPDFRVHDEEKRTRCAIRHFCQLCGDPLGLQIVFVGNWRSVERRTFGEPPMHRECFEYAREVCPWLAGRGWRDEWRAAAAEIRIAPTPSEPDAVGIYTTDGYRLINDDEGVSRFKYRANPPTELTSWHRR